jgi:hypothetical protein
MQFFGCYSYQEITKEEFINADDYMDLKVTTKDRYTYKFDEGDYLVKEDSIYGSGEFLNNKLKETDYKEFTGSISLGDIESLKFDSFDTISTMVGIIALGGLIALMISEGSFRHGPH